MKKAKAKPNGTTPPAPSLVIVRWRDTLHSVGWESPTDIATNCPTFSSVGWIAYEDAETLKLATTLAADNTGAGILSIPRGCVVEVVTNLKS